MVSLTECSTISKDYQNIDLIVANGIIVKFGGKIVVDGMDINVISGEIYGFLWLNGAGKTTTIMVLITLLPPSSGKIQIDSMYVLGDNKDIRKIIGAVQQQISLDKDISASENIICHALLHKLSKESIKKRLENISQTVKLTSFLNYTVINLSGGWQKKIAINCALIYDPKIFFFYEPTVGLDAQSRHMLWNLIRQLNKVGTFGALAGFLLKSLRIIIFITSLIVVPMISLCGTFFSVSSLPTTLQYIIAALPIKYSTDCIRSAVWGRSFSILSVVCSSYILNNVVHNVLLYAIKRKDLIK